MNTRILELYKNQALLKASDINLLEKEIRKQPYMQSLRAMHLLAMHRFQPQKYQQTLALTAAYTTDKKVLYELINGKPKHINMPESPLLSLANDPIKPLREQAMEHILHKTQAPKVEEKTLGEKLQAIADEKAQLNQDLALLKEQKPLPEDLGQKPSHESMVDNIQNVDNSAVETSSKPLESPEQEDLGQKPSHESMVDNIQNVDNSVVETSSKPLESPEQEDLGQKPSHESMVDNIGNVDNSAEETSSKPTKNPPTEEEEVFLDGQTSFHETTTDGDDFWIKNPVKPVVIDEKPALVSNEIVAETPIEEETIVKEEISPETPEEIIENTNEIAEDMVIHLEKEETLIEETSNENTQWQPMQLDLPKQDALINKSNDVVAEISAAVAVTEASSAAEIEPINITEDESPVPSQTENIRLGETKIEAENTAVLPESESSTPINQEKLQEELVLESTSEEEQSNVPEFISSWKSWLKMTPVNPETEKEDPKTYIIDRFIDLNPKLIKKPEQEFKFVEKDSDISHLMTETLAKIYVDQKYYAKAIWAYGVLIKKNPEKKFEYKNQIKAINKLIK